LLVPPGQAPAPGAKLARSQSRAFLSDDGMPQPIEFFIASDASAIVEHTKRVLYLEDDDVAHIAEGGDFQSISCQTVTVADTKIGRVSHPPTAQGRRRIDRTSYRDS